MIQYVGALLRDAFLLAPAALAVLLFIADWGWRLRYGATFPVPLWLYPVLLLLGFVLSGYRTYRHQQTRIQELEAASAGAPQSMSWEAAHERVIEPLKTAGWDVILPAPGDVFSKSLEGWEEVLCPDAQGVERPVFIVNRRGEAEHAVMKQQAPGFGLSEEARETMDRLHLCTKGRFPHGLFYKEYDQGGFLSICGERLFADQPGIARRVLDELQEVGYLRFHSGAVYVLTPAGEREAQRIHESRSRAR